MAKGLTALRNVRKYFPGVARVKDATQPINVEVTGDDLAASREKAHDGCAMAVACKRALELDGMIVSRATAYAIKGDTATRYIVPPSVRQEVISFDRGAGFEPGVYSLARPTRWYQLAVDKHKIKSKRKVKKGAGRPIIHRHYVTGIRAVLGSSAGAEQTA